MTFKCELDPKLTEKDLPFFIPDIQGTWGSACGRNRGVFVVDPPDGHTYGEFNLMYIIGEAGGDRSSFALCEACHFLSPCGVCIRVQIFISISLFSFCVYCASSAFNPGVLRSEKNVCFESFGGMAKQEYVWSVFFFGIFGVGATLSSEA